MAREYGTRRATRQNGGASQQLLVIAVSFLLGYVTASLVDVDKLGVWIGKQLAASEHPTVAQSEPSHPAVPQKPKFEFYTLLTNEKAEAAQQAARDKSSDRGAHKPFSTKDAAASATAAAQVALNNKQTKKVPPRGAKKEYVIQVASFKTRQDADHLKASLILKGFEVNVVPVSQPQGSWFRVIVGPYTDKAMAQKVQSILVKNEQIHGIVRASG